MKYYFTIDIGGTDMKYGVINENYELVFTSLTPTNAHLGGKSIINRISELFYELSKNYKLEGVAISSTGVIDEETQVLTPNPSIKDYMIVNFKRDLAHLNVPVSAENDVNSVGIWENTLVENSNKLKCLVAITVGTGIGGAIFIDGKLYRGSLFSAGEWGKIFINDKSYEEIASTYALIENAMKVDKKLDSGIKVFEEYDKGNKKIIEVVDNFYDNLAVGIANIIYILNPDHIIIGGGVTNRGQRFLDELNAKLRPKIWDYFDGKYKITLAKTRNAAGMMGAYKKFRLTFDN